MFSEEMVWIGREIIKNNLHLFCLCHDGAFYSQRSPFEVLSHCNIGNVTATLHTASVIMSRGCYCDDNLKGQF